MQNAPRFHAIFSDVGGVLGTNGWDTTLRRKTAAHFHCETAEIEKRHGLVFDSFERGYMRFDDYIRHVFFSNPRAFTAEDVRDFAYRHSVAWAENIELLREVKRLNGLKLGLISNEGEGLTNYRVQSWGLRDWADFLIFSHCVRLRKPDRAIWQLALDLCQAHAAEVIYIDDRAMFVDIARDIGFTAIQHVSLEGTRSALAEAGLAVP
jgi:putative hydrolase of the HAD superfamily